MTLRRKLALAFTFVLSTAAVHADPVVYVLTGGQQFGTIDLATGFFTSLGPGLTEGSGGLVRGSSGNLLTLTFSGNLNSIDPSTGATTLVGATGLGDCSTAASLCGPTSANVLGKLGSTLYATDFQNNLYKVDPVTGLATLIGPTGIPAIPFIPLSPVPGDPDGSFNVYDESLFEHAGKLYANFAAGTFDPVTFTPSPIIDARLYQIDPVTALATLIAPTSFGLSTIVDVNGTTYAFDTAQGALVTLNLTNGDISYVRDIDPNAGLIAGAAAPAPVPEPASLALVGSGMAAIAAGLRRRWKRTA